MRFSRLFGRTRKVRRRRSLRLTSPDTKHYEAHKERARKIVHARLAYWNQFYGHEYKRVAIRNQRSRWGSCSTKQNLNFNYRIAFLPEPLIDYIIVHELCHLRHFNHSESFWSTVAETIADFEVRKKELISITKDFQTYMQQTPALETL